MKSKVKKAVILCDKDHDANWIPLSKQTQSLRDKTNVKIRELGSKYFQTRNLFDQFNLRRDSLFSFGRMIEKRYSATKKITPLRTQYKRMKESIVCWYSENFSEELFTPNSQLFKELYEFNIIFTNDNLINNVSINLANQINNIPAIKIKNTNAQIKNTNMNDNKSAKNKTRNTETKLRKAKKLQYPSSPPSPPSKLSPFPVPSKLPTPSPLPLRSPLPMTSTLPLSSSSQNVSSEMHLPPNQDNTDTDIIDTFDENDACFPTLIDEKGSGDKEDNNQRNYMQENYSIFQNLNLIDQSDSIFNPENYPITSHINLNQDNSIFPINFPILTNYPFSYYDENLSLFLNDGRANSNNDDEFINFCIRPTKISVDGNADVSTMKIHFNEEIDKFQYKESKNNKNPSSNNFNFDDLNF